MTLPYEELRQLLQEQLDDGYYPSINPERARELLAALTEAEQAQFYKHASEALCKCGHLLAAHQSHCHVIGTPEPQHCSQLCGCRAFDPALPRIVELESQLAAREKQLERAEVLLRFMKDDCEYRDSVTLIETRLHEYFAAREKGGA